MRDWLADDSHHGQFCDISAPDAKQPQWAAFLSKVVPQYPHRFSFVTEEKEHPQPIPHDPNDALILGLSDSGPWPSLSIDLLGLDVRVHFFGPDSLELGAWRTDITEERYVALADLMRRMGEVMCADVFMLPETDPVKAAMVYVPSAREFRRPRHGVGDFQALQSSTMDELEGALRPLLATGPDLSDSIVAEVKIKVEAIMNRHSALTLLDALTVQQRNDLDHAWSLAATIVTPARGSGAEENRNAFVRDLHAFARRILTPDAIGRK